jgi:uncharacterized membrane protein YkoI
MTSYHILKTAMAALIATGPVAIAATTIAKPAIAAEQSAGKDDASEYAKLGGAKLSLADAVSAAEKQFGGKAVNAALDNEQASAAFEVELMTDAGSQTVAVDGQTGEVKSVKDSGENGKDGEDVE